MSRVPLPRFSNLSSLQAGGGASSTSSSGGGALPGDAPTTWAGLYKSATELKAIRDAAFAALDSNKQGFVSLNVRPALYEIQKELERSAVRNFGLLGRLALMRATPEECGTELLPLPALVLAFAVHSCILNAGFVCTGSSTGDFSEVEAWPNALPAGWLDDTGSKFSFRYRLRSGASDKLVWKGVVMSDLLAISANDPYSSGKDAMTMHLRIKDFVRNKAGEAPSLIESKEKELHSVIEERIIPIGMATAQRKSPQPSFPDEGPSSSSSGMGAYPPDVFVTGPGMGGGFGGDLMPGAGGSMLFGPGNPQFDARFRPGGVVDPRRGGGGRVPEARFDPYSPFGSRNGDPDPDDIVMPGPRGPMSNFPSGPTGPRRSNFDGFI